MTAPIPLTKAPRPDPDGWITRRSELDASVNFTRPGENGRGVEEARYVCRGDDATIYLSAQVGCAQACRFCWLTASRQGRADDVPVHRIVQQADRVLRHMAEVKPAVRVCNVAFMARGEPLASRVFLDGLGGGLLRSLAQIVAWRGYLPRIKVSTILPEACAGADLAALLASSGVQPDLYYSMYSTRDAFRRRWLPHALPVEEALPMLADYQRATHKIPRVHLALIAGENDALSDAQLIAAAVEAAGLRVDYNLVRYNPPTPDHGAEASELQIQRFASMLAKHSPGAAVQVVTRVGPDVMASCGMFVQRDQSLATDRSA